MAASCVQWLILAVCVAACQVDATAYFVPERRKCVHTNVRKLLAADCHGINLVVVPQQLNTGIEVLDLSFNRIRKLMNTDFYKYPYVQLLYLGDNLISHIDNNTFSSLQYLEVLNMSLNAIHAIPSDLFHLSYLRKLTIDFNNLNRDTFNELEAAPIMKSLKYLSMSNCMLKEFPPLAKFPYIEFLNLSGNSLAALSARQLAPACLLKVVDVSGNVNLPDMSSCSCDELKSWTNLREIEVQPPLKYICSPSQQDQMHKCTTNTSVRDTDQLYSTCQDMHFSLQQTAAWREYGIIFSICLICVLLVSGCFMAYWFKCRKSSSNAALEPRARCDRGDQPGDDKDLLSFTHNTEA